MKIKLIGVLLICSISNCIFAQQSTGSIWYKAGNYFEIIGTIGRKEYSGSLSWHHLHGIGKKKAFKIGYGARFTAYTGRDKDFITAPAKLTSGETGPQVLFSGYKNENIDTVHFGNVQANYINAFITLQYTFFKKLDLGFNIDVVGFGFGKNQVGAYKPNQRYTDYQNPGSIAGNQRIYYPGPVGASPTAFNLLLVSDNDLGSLNSELFLRYWFTEKWAVKGGFAFMFTEYQTYGKYRLDNDRFRLKSGMALLGITYTPFK